MYTLLLSGLMLVFALYVAYVLCKKQIEIEELKIEIEELKIEIEELKIELYTS
jgi:uncharacterized OsmC-like protein